MLKTKYRTYKMCECMNKVCGISVRIIEWKISDPLSEVEQY